MQKVNTKIVKIDKQNIDEDKIRCASEILKKGGLVAFPTETVYGLGANALDEAAVEKIFEAKGRPQDNPLIVHISHINQIKHLVQSVPEKAYKLMEKFWPGPLTILFNKSENIPYKVTAGLPTVAIRMPNHKIALEIIRNSKIPIAAPSANISGKPSPTYAKHVIEDLNGKIDMIIDGGSTGVGVESTVLDISTEIPVILRPGGVTREDLLTVFEQVTYDAALEGNNKELIPKSPGQKYRHYSPKAEMIVFEGEVNDIIEKIKIMLEQYLYKGMKVGIMATKQTKNHYNYENVIVVGDRENPETIAANLFEALRQFDKIGVDIILAEGISEKGIGKAVMNRMKKASTKRR